MMKIKGRAKNKLLFLALFIGNIPRTFFDLDTRFNLSLFIERSTRIDFFIMYYVNAINFMILAYCLHYHTGINKNVTKFILIMTILDFLHLLLFAMKGYGLAKIGIAFIIYWSLNHYQILKNDKNKIPS